MYCTYVCIVRDGAQDDLLLSELQKSVLTRARELNERRVTR